MFLRVLETSSSSLWVDEAESCINALTILDEGVPVNGYLGLPIYENTLTEPYEGHPEYEFRDSSYSKKGYAVYHGWLPLYGIAAAQKLAGMTADHRGDDNSVKRDPEQVRMRTYVPRLPALGFSLAFMIVVWRLAREIGGELAGVCVLFYAAVGGRAVHYGFQARYYSLTLLMTSLAAFALWRLVQRGRWRDYAILGMAEGLLFHTHQLSSVVFAMACVLALPLILTHQRWLLKSLMAAAIAAVLTVPWAFYTGFFDTASGVPKVGLLFESWTDRTRYILNRPASLSLLLFSCGILFVSWKAPQFLPRVSVASIRKKHHIYGFVIGWMLISYTTFHTIIPAASYFTSRLTLILYVPFGFLIGVLISDLTLSIRRDSRVRGLTAAVASMLVLAIQGNLPEHWLKADESWVQVTSAAVEELNQSAYPPDTRFYSTPNQHLIFTYYTGLPVQSVAPVRKSFLNSFSGTVVLIEPIWFYGVGCKRLREKIEAAASNASMPLTKDDLDEFEACIRMNLAADELQSYGLPTRPHDELPEFFDDVYLESRDTLQQSLAEYFEDSSQHAVLRRLGVANVRDLWMAFFYRFVDFPSRVGKNANIYPLLEQSHLRIVPQAGIALYEYERGPVRIASDET